MNGMDANECGLDIPIGELVPLNKRDINLKSNRDYQRVLATVRSVGLIAPVAVYRENERYVILNGYLRYKACEELGIPIIPCLVFKDKDAYTFNRMVSPLSHFQEMRMLEKACEKINEKTLVKVFGKISIRYRLAPTLLKQLHPQVAKAFENEHLSRNACKDLTAVQPERQVEILKEMKSKQNYGQSFLRALILGTPDQQMNPKKARPKKWSKDPAKRDQLVARLDEAARQHDFYSASYRRYSTDLLKMCFYVRQFLTNPTLAAYLEAHQPEVFGNLTRIVFETQG
jgi:hypothetical protein